MNKSKFQNIGIWVLSVAVSALFLMSAIPKFLMPGWVTRFAEWGYPEWFLYAIGALEAAGAIGLLIPRIAPFAAGGLILILFGAAYTHFTHEESVLMNLGYIVGLAVIGLYRWKQSKT